MKMNPVVHFEMPAKDKKRVKKFYEDVFGWKMQQMGQDMGNYILAMTTVSDEKGPKKPGAINGGFFEYDSKKPGFQQPSIVIAVDNLKQSIGEIKKAGGKVLSKPMEIPGIGMFASIRDTEGNRLGILQPSSM